MNWKRIGLWAIGIVVGVVVIVFVGGYAVLHSDYFQHYVIGKVVDQAQEATGGKVSIQNVWVDPSSLSAHLYGIVIHGTEGPNQAPLLQVPEVSIDLKVISLLKRKFGVQEILVTRPAVHLVLDKQGRSNIPTPNAPKQTDSQANSSQTNLFKLAVNHVLLSDGAIYFDDRQAPLNADIHNLRTEINFNSAPTSYEGTVSYDEAKLQYGNMHPLPHSLNLKFVATPSQLNVKSMDLDLGASHAQLQATLKNYSQPQVNGTYRLKLHTPDFSALMKPASVSGDIALAGDLHYQSQPGVPLLESVTLNGNLDAGELRLASPQARVTARDLHGNYKLVDGNLIAKGIGVDLLGGHITTDLRMQNLGQTPSTRVDVRLNNISVGEAKRAITTASNQQVPLTGVINGSAQASWTGSIKNLQVKSDIAIQGAIQKSSKQAAVPVNGVIHVAYDGPHNVITVRQSKLRLPSATIVANGTISDHSQLTIQAHSSDIHDLIALADSLGKTPSNSTKKPFVAHGAATLNATVRGSLQHPQVTAQVAGQGLRIQNSSWRNLQLNAQASPSRLVIQNASFVSGRGHIKLSGNVQLDNWSYKPSNQINLHADISHVPVAEIQQLANVDYPVSGVLSGNFDVHGSPLNPIGNGTAQISNASVYGQPVQAVSAQFQATGNEVRSSLDVKTAAGSGVANLVYMPKTEAYQLQLNVPGIEIQKLEAVQAKDVPLAGTLTLTATGSGTLQDPQLTASVEVPKLQLQQTTVRDVNAHLNVANHVAEFSLGSDLENANIRGQGTVRLTGDYVANATLDTSRIPLDPLLATYLSSFPSDAHAQIELHASLQGPLKDKNRLEAHIAIPTFAAEYQQIQIANSGPIRADYAHSVLVLQPSELKGTDTSLKFQGRVPLPNTAAMNLTAQGRINLKLIRIFSPDIQSSGTVLLDVSTRGVSGGTPQVEGQIRLQKVSIITPSAPVGLENLNGVLTVANDRIHIDQLTGQSGGGTVSIGGSIGYRPQLQFDVAVDAKSVRVLYSGIRTVIDGTLAATGTTQASSVTGRVLIDSLSFTPDFDLAGFMAQTSTPSLPSATPTFTDNMKLDITVQSSSELSAVSSEVSVEGTANLRVVNTASNPVITGRTDLSSGEIFFLKQRYQLERGIINFVNPSQTEPVVNILITTVIQQYNLSLTIVGPVSKLRTTYTSDPPLPPVDIINLIARGQTTEEAAPGNFDANQVIAGQLAGQVSSRLGKLAGISSLTIDPLIGGNNQNPSARVAIQQRVTRNFIFTFSTDVTNPQAEVFQGEYQLTPKWSVSASRDQYGGFSFDGKYHTTF